MTAIGRRSAGLADGVKVGNIPVDTLHRSIVSTVADALRAGVPAVPLDGWTAMRSLTELVFVNERRERLGRLETEHAQALRRARACRDLAVEEPDPAAAAGYKDDVRRHTSRAAEIARDIERARTTKSGGQLPREFEGEVDYIIAAMGALLAPGGRIGKEERQALRKVLRNLRITPGPGYVTWSLELLLPADGRVLTLGPVTGRVEVTGRAASPAEVAARSNSAGAASARRRVVHALMAAGFPNRVARPVSLEPSGLVARALLGEDIVWPGCDKGFDHAAFNEHVRAHWPTDLRWAVGAYVQTSPKKQALVDVVAALGGQARMDQMNLFGESYGFDGNAVYVMTLPYTGRGSTCWPAPVERTGSWTAATGAWESTMRNLQCPLCHKPATAVVRVPEVPEAILCRDCCVMPGRPDFPFPPQYLSLALPETDVSSELVARARSLAPGLVHKGPKRRDEVE